MTPTANFVSPSSDISRRGILSAVVATAGTTVAACAAADAGRPPLPSRIIDLSPTITEDLPVRFWGHRTLSDLGFSDTTEFRVITGSEPAYYSNSYYTLFNHGGPHVDAPNHGQRGTSGVDAYKLESLVGPITLIDARGPAVDQRITKGELERTRINAGDVAIVLTGYSPPTGRDELPRYRALNKEAAEYLAQIPVKAFATDTLGVDFWGPSTFVYEQSVHHSFLSRGIPAIEQLINLEALIGVQNAVFVGLPLKFKDGDGSPIRAAAFVY